MKPTANGPSGRDEAIEATAAAWLAQRDDGLSAEDEAAFARWRAEHPAHEEAVARIEAAWRDLLQLRSYRPEAHRHPDRDLLAEPRRRKVIPFPALAAAAGLAAALALAAVWWTGRAPAPVPAAAQRYVTTVGGYQRVTLTDGSLLELNASTEVRVDYTPAERHVWLDRGEANFSVAKNKARPFLVQAGTVTVRAVGTAFNVRLDTGKVEVLVTEGKVQVNATAAPAQPVTAPAIEPALLQAGQRAIISIQNPAVVPTAFVEQVASETIRETLAWQGPRLVFVDTPLREVVAQFNRHNQVQIELADPALGSLPVGGSFRVENIEAFVRLLASDRDIGVDRVNPDRIVLRRSK